MRAFVPFSIIEIHQLPYRDTMSNNSKIKKFYDDRALQYVDMIKGMDYTLPQWMITHIHESPGIRILDLGCGAGNIGKLIKQELTDADLWGVDLSSGMVEEARRLNIYQAVFQFDLSKGLPDEILKQKFDLILGFGFLEFLKTPSQLLQLASTLLNLDGQIWWSIEASTEKSAPSGEVRPELGFPMYHYQASELDQILSQAQLEPKLIEQINSYKRSYDQYFVPWWIVQCRKSNIET